MTAFDDFRTALCDLAGVAPPVPAEGPDGTGGFTIVIGGARIEFLQGVLGGDPAVLMSTLFGKPPPEKEADVLRVLLDANFELAGAGAPSFARNAATREISLQHTLLLSQADVQSIYASMLAAVEAVAEWRETYFLTPMQNPPDARALLQSLV